ncbi:Putative metallo-beta-lactamase, zn-dependent metallo-hydrolase, RNA specificity [Septoria linicola]|uniref:Cleavage and polyadenylation specificity factor subunit 2 n=1 Tax=Septoria linicola TaxID=215465 RepID=A0A9Q9B021_9PEZI|nr:Putative metallo-beta-lactamase, zn-dependent metallo-hydrolase, RNA specificity [Septoria linicola]
MFHFTPLLGAQSQSAASQSLLELDGGVKILVDVGWDEAFDAEQLQALEKHVSTLSVVLLTHATIDHMGAYAHCCKHIPHFSKVPVYATTPVINLGRTLLADLYASSPLAASIIPSSAIAANALEPDTDTDTAPKLLYHAPSADDIATYFSAIHPLRYSQPHQPVPSSFSPPVGNLTITAYSAGHTPGGTIWHIQHSLESIVYAADWNQGRENLLSGAAWLAGGANITEGLQRPTALICSSKGVEKTESLPRKKRDEILISLIRETIAQGGKVLIPTDSSARVLELAFMLNHTWRENISGPHAETYRNARIYMASRTSKSTVRQLSSMLEWMDDAIIRDAEAAMNKTQADEGRVPNLLEWQYVKQIESRNKLDQALRRKRPCILLASDASLEWGFSRQAMEKLAADPRNLVILTENVSQTNPAQLSLAQQLADFWQTSTKSGSQTGAKVVGTDGRSLQLRQLSAEGLTTEEDMLYQQYAARQQQLHSNLQGDNTANDTATAEIAEDQAEESSDDDDEDEDPEHQGRALNLSAQMTQSNKRKAGLSDAELGINVLIRSKHVHDFDVRNRKGRDKVFPFVQRKPKSDDYGDIIKPEDYLRAEERDTVDGVDMRAEVKQEAAAVGQKRKWGDVNGSNVKGKKDRKLQPDKRQKVEEKREPDDIDALIAKATGVTGADGVDAVESESEDDESDYEPDEGEDKPHQKAVLTTFQLTLQLRIAHIDFSGLHEKRDLQMLIPLIKPRKLILISGSESETQTLAAECRNLLSEGGEQKSDVFAPVVGEIIDASVDTNAWTIKLSRQLVKKLTWQNVRGLGVVALTGRLHAEPIEDDRTADQEENVKKKLKMLKGDSEDAEEQSKVERSGIPAVPVLDLVQTAMTTHHRATQPVHVGDLKLTDMRKLMIASGHSAEFRGEGTLLIDHTVVVRKSPSGKIEVEAGPGGLQKPQFRTKDNEASFYAVRKLIYGGLAVVAGV